MVKHVQVSFEVCEHRMWRTQNPLHFLCIYLGQYRVFTSNALWTAGEFYAGAFRSVWLQFLAIEKQGQHECSTIILHMYRPSVEINWELRNTEALHESWKPCPTDFGSCRLFWPTNFRWTRTLAERRRKKRSNHLLKWLGKRWWWAF